MRVYSLTAVPKVVAGNCNVRLSVLLGDSLTSSDNVPRGLLKGVSSQSPRDLYCNCNCNLTTDQSK